MDIPVRFTIPFAFLKKVSIFIISVKFLNSIEKISQIIHENGEGTRTPHIVMTT